MSSDEFEVVGEYAHPEAFEEFVLDTMGVGQISVDIRQKLDELSIRRGNKATTLSISFVVRTLINYPPHFVISADRVDVDPRMAIEIDSRTDPVTVRYVQTER